MGRRRGSGWLALGPGWFLDPKRATLKRYGRQRWRTKLVYLLARNILGLVLGKHLLHGKPNSQRSIAIFTKHDQPDSLPEHPHRLEVREHGPRNLAALPWFLLEWAESCQISADFVVDSLRRIQRSPSQQVGSVSQCKQIRARPRSAISFTVACGWFILSLSLSLSLPPSFDVRVIGIRKIN